MAQLIRRIHKRKALMLLEDLQTEDAHKRNPVKYLLGVLWEWTPEGTVRMCLVTSHTGKPKPRLTLLTHAGSQVFNWGGLREKGSIDRTINQLL